MALHINENTAFPHSKHSSVLILTDLEPDDILALKMLSKRLRDVQVLAIVGESKENKYLLATQIFQSYGYKNFQVLQGKHSTKDFPRNIEAFGIPSASLIPEQALKIDITATVETFLSDSLADNNSPLIICLKPFWELLEVKVEILGRCVMLMYGSFNIRAMRGAHSDSFLTDFINTSFKYVVLYESFHATSDNNSVNLINAPQLFNIIESDKGLSSMISKWNSLIITECLDHIAQSCLKIKYLYSTTGDSGESLGQVSASMGRSYKIVNNIIEAKNQQMVLADAGLISFVFNNMPSETRVGRIWMDSYGYTQFTTDSSERNCVYLVKQVGFNDVVQGICDMLNYD